MFAAEGERWRDHTRTGVVWGGAYLLIALTVLLIELNSEHDKLDRGAYSNQFDALTFARIVTLPVAFLVPRTAPDDRGALNESAWQVGAAALGQAIVIGLIAMTLSWLTSLDTPGLVKRDDSVRPLVYQAAASREKTQRRMLHDLIQKVYDGSALSLVLQALSSKKASQEELREIRRLLDELEGEKP